MAESKIYGIVMAGGGGTRFWPMSTRKEPKQFLNLSGKEILVNETIDRQASLIGKENIFIVTNASQAQLMYEKCAGRVKRSQILAEPAARNTAACIGYAAMEILRKYGDGILCIFAADAHIKDEAEYARVMKLAVEAAEETDALVTVGIRPTFPSTGYGYILSRAAEGKPYRIVEEFVEKPDAETAAAYVASGNYAWNSGMFVWKASTILGYYQKLLPDVYACLQTIGEAMGTEREQEVLWEVYPKIPKISVDYGIMERAEHVLMLEGDFGWSDVGSWDALDAVRTRDENGNITSGETVLLDAKNCVVYGSQKLIAAVGVEGLAIVEADQAVLVCPVQDAQRVKEVVDRLQAEGREQYL